MIPLTALSQPSHRGPYVVPVDRNRVMITREFLVFKPQFEPQVGWRHNHLDIKLTLVEGNATSPAGSCLEVLDFEGSSLLDFLKLILLDSLQVAFHVAKLIRSICETCNVSQIFTTCWAWWVSGTNLASCCWVAVTGLCER